MARIKDPGDACWQMLLGAFRPQTTTEDKKVTNSERSASRIYRVTQPLVARSRRTPRVLILPLLFGAFRPPKPENKTPLDLLLLFPYSSPHARSALPQVLRGLLQEVRPRRVSRNRHLPCQLDICGVLPMWGEAEVSALRGDPWQAPFRGSQTESPPYSLRWATRAPSGTPRTAPWRATGRRPLIIPAKAPV